MNRQPVRGQQNLLSMTKQMFVNEGVLSFYKGFTANFFRQGSYISVMFVSLEQIRAFFGKYAESNDD